MTKKILKNKKDLERVAYLYAQSILNIARANDTVDLLEKEFGKLENKIISNMTLKKYLTDSSVDKAEKIKKILGILNDKASDEIQSVALIIVILDVVDILEEIYDQFVKLVRKLKRQMKIEVISTSDLDEKTIKEIKEEVDKETGMDVEIKNVIDTDIIGGVIIRIGDRIIDLSVKGKINDLREKLKSIELKGSEFNIEDQGK